MPGLLAGARRDLEGLRRLGLLGLLASPRAATAGCSSETPRRSGSRLLDRRLSGDGHGRACRASASGPGARRRGRVDAAGPRRLRAAGRTHVRPFPQVRVRLLRSGLLRGLLHAGSAGGESAPPGHNDSPAGVEHVSPSMWVWTRLMFVGVAIDRVHADGSGATRRSPDEKDPVVRPDRASEGEQGRVSSHGRLGKGSRVASAAHRRSGPAAPSSGRSWTGLGPSHTAKRASAKSRPSMVPRSVPRTVTRSPCPAGTQVRSMMSFSLDVRNHCAELFQPAA